MVIIIKKNSAFIILPNTCKKLAEHWLRTSALECHWRERLKSSAKRLDPVGAGFRFTRSSEGTWVCCPVFAVREQWQSVQSNGTVSLRWNRNSTRDQIGRGTSLGFAFTGDSAGVAVERSVHLRIEIGQQKWYGNRNCVRLVHRYAEEFLAGSDRSIGRLMVGRKWKLCFASSID